MPAPSIAELNGMPAADAAAALTVLFEAAPRYVTRLVAARPYAGETDLWERAETIALELPEDEAVELVNAHPRLGEAATAMSALSRHEQGDAPPAPVHEHLAELNAGYEDEFGFRYCVFVAGRSPETLVPELEARLASGDRSAELRRARRDVVAIARDRYRRLRAEGRTEAGA